MFKKPSLPIEQIWANHVSELPHVYDVPDSSVWHCFTEVLTKYTIRITETEITEMIKTNYN